MKEKTKTEIIPRPRDIFWLIVLRLIMVTSLIISYFIIQYSTSIFLPLNPFYYFILASYFLSLVYYLLYRWGRYYLVQAYAQIFIDLLLITVLVYISGGFKGSFYILYIFGIIAASMVISKRATYIFASLSAILFGLMVDGLYFGIIPYYGPERVADISLGMVLNNIFIAWSVFFLVAFLMNYLTGSLKKTREELRLAQKELEIKKRLALAGELSAQVAHEIRNPLAAVSGSVQVLKNELDLSEDKKNLMDIIIRESKRASQSMEQFLSFASPGKKTFTSINLSSTLKDSLILLQRSGELNGNYKIKGNYESSKLRYYGNINQFKQLFWNLIKNSLKAMPEGGELTVDFNPKKKDGIELKFKDTGKGMSEEEKKNIFEPFYSSFSEGNGIGMAVVRRIVDDYNGRIEVHSEINKGTEITITLPNIKKGSLGKT